MCGGGQQLDLLNWWSRVKHLLQQSNHGAMAQLCSIYPNSTLGTVNSEVCLEPDLVKLLSHFEYVFSSKPKGLPPPRAQDHKDKFSIRKQLKINFQF